MRASIISIGNSKGVRIPKALLDESGIIKDVELHLSKHGITIMAIEPADDDALLGSQKALSKDWDRPEEDAAWSNL